MICLTPYMYDDGYSPRRYVINNNALDYSYGSAMIVRFAFYSNGKIYGIQLSNYIEKIICKEIDTRNLAFKTMEDAKLYLDKYLENNGCILLTEKRYELLKSTIL